MPCPDPIADDDRTAAEHRFVNDNPKSIILAGEHQNVGCPINSRQARLIDKTEEAGAMGNA